MVYRSRGKGMAGSDGYKKQGKALEGIRVVSALVGVFLGRSLTFVTRPLC